MTLSLWCSTCGAYHHNDRREFDKPEEYKAMLRLQSAEAIKLRNIPKVYFS